MVVDIIIPHTWGRVRGLVRLFESLEKLDYDHSKIHIYEEMGEETVPFKVNNAYKKGRGDFIVYASDDCEFEPDSLKLAIEDSLVNNKGLVAFDTGVRNDEGYICEHFLITRKLADELGEIFDTDFHHVGVDDLLWKRAEALGQAMVGRGKVKHHHFSRVGSGIEPDDVIKKGWAHVAEDRKLLEKKLKEYGLQ